MMEDPQQQELDFFAAQTSPEEDACDDLPEDCTDNPFAENAAADTVAVFDPADLAPPKTARPAPAKSCNSATNV